MNWKEPSPFGRKDICIVGLLYSNFGGRGTWEPVASLGSEFSGVSMTWSISPLKSESWTWHLIITDRRGVYFAITRDQDALNNSSSSVPQILYVKDSI